MFSSRPGRLYGGRLGRNAFKYFSTKPVELHPLRPPVVTIMGHVDHGKTTILDFLRKTSVVVSEAGGITQHIGAFSVNVSSVPLGGSISQITFLDTPGHVAFTKMRERGAKVTDIVALVVSVDDGIMAQTVESIKLALAQKVPIIVAFNKCDKFGMDKLSKFKEELLKHEVVCEDFGGETQCVAVSGLTGLNMDKLLEAIVAQGELMELRADPQSRVKTAVIESRVKAGLGDCATVLVQEGTLKTGMFLAADDTICKVRTLTDCSGRAIKEATPSTPVEISGWRTVPRVGAIAVQCSSENEAQEYADEFIRLEEIDRSRRLNKTAREREQIHERMWEFLKAREKDPTIAPRGTMKYEDFAERTDDRLLLPLLIKCDVLGSQEAILKVIKDIKSSKVHLDIVGVGVGAVVETDIRKAQAMKASILAFNIKTPKSIQKMAKTEMVSINEFNIIYRLQEHVTEAMKALLPPEWALKQIGKASVLQMFLLDGTTPVAGCRIDEGTIIKSIERVSADTDRYVIQLTRNGRKLWEGRIRTMKHLKKDISAANKGLECGIVLDGFNGPFEVEDAIICIENKSKPPTL